MDARPQCTLIYYTKLAGPAICHFPLSRLPVLNNCGIRRRLDDWRDIRHVCPLEETALLSISIPIPLERLIENIWP